VGAVVSDAWHGWTPPYSKYRGSSFELSRLPLFVVLRAARGVAPNWMPADLEGRWYDRAWFDAPPRTLDDANGAPHALIVPTNRVEHREDGAAASVWELHPPDGNYANDGDEQDRRP
jgi:hypothetical protein